MIKKMIIPETTHDRTRNLTFCTELLMLTNAGNRAHANLFVVCVIQMMLQAGKTVKCTVLLRQCLLYASLFAVM